MVKENQKLLYQDIEVEFKFNKPVQSHLGHGRIETRKYSLINKFEFIENQKKWINLKSIVKIESIREFKKSDKPIETAIRYYISSLETNAEVFLYFFDSLTIRSAVFIKNSTKIFHIIIHRIENCYNLQLVIISKLGVNRLQLIVVLNKKDCFLRQSF